jgi:hypothetical protein
MPQGYGDGLATDLDAHENTIRAGPGFDRVAPAPEPSQ